MASTRAYLLPYEQEALCREVDALLAEKGTTQTSVGKKLGVSQGAVWKARKNREVGPDVARKIERHLKTTTAQLVEKHKLKPAVVTVSDPLEIAIAYWGDLVGPEAVRRVRARVGHEAKLAHEFGEILIREQEDLLHERTPVVSHAAPDSSTRKRNR